MVLSIIVLINQTKNSFLNFIIKLKKNCILHLKNNAEGYGPNNYADRVQTSNNYPNGYLGFEKRGERFYDLENGGKEVLGLTYENGAKIDIFKAAFTSKNNLYLIIGHEFYHTRLFLFNVFNGYGNNHMFQTFDEFHHYYIKKWQQAKYEIFYPGYTYQYDVISIQKDFSILFFRRNLLKINILF